MTRPSFDDSEELKFIFNRELNNWKEKTHATLEHLADLCGVTPSYLGLVGRYGRVPSRSVLILLALNFQMSSPKDLLRAAGVDAYWPYPEGSSITQTTAKDQRFLSLSLDMQGFSESIREIVRSELRPKRLSELLKGRAINFGVNINQAYLTESPGKGSNSFTTSLVKVLSQNLQQSFTEIDSNHANAFEQLAEGKLDIFGPVHTTPRRLGLACYTTAFAKVQVAALWRKKAVGSLQELPKPKSWEDLKNHAYILSVFNKTSGHEFALTRLNTPPSNLLVADSPMEALERITMKSAGRAAHLIIVEAPIAEKIAKEHPDEVETLFIGPKNPHSFEIAFAVRPDWAEIAHQLSETLNFLNKDGTMRELLQFSTYKTLVYPVGG
jgi:hypothetical protein